MRIGRRVRPPAGVPAPAPPVACRDGGAKTGTGPAPRSATGGGTAWTVDGHPGTAGRDMAADQAVRKRIETGEAVRTAWITPR
ncbi:hypothetical protein [Streptosporangium sp. NPDC006007]|uniref:hypothetical protein n=1 Tax=Streptosporangium sp. NPDC006007 TaxID=3154575 RepID=UPI0033A6FA26